MRFVDEKKRKKLEWQNVDAKKKKKGICKQRERDDIKQIKNRNRNRKKMYMYFKKREIQEGREKLHFV